MGGTLTIGTGSIRSRIDEHSQAIIRIHSGAWLIQVHKQSADACDV